MDSKLRYVYSPMEAGKSAMLLIEASNFERRNIGILCMKPSIDDRDGIDKIKSRIEIERAMIRYIKSMRRPAIANEKVIYMRDNTILGNALSTVMTVFALSVILNITINPIAINTTTRSTYEVSRKTFQVVVSGLIAANPIPSAA